MFKLLFLILFFRFPTNFIESADDYGFAANQAYIEAIKAFRKHQYSDSAKLFKEAARRGHPEADYFLGRMVEVGHGYKKNQKRAYYFFKNLEILSFFICFGPLLTSNSNSSRKIRRMQCSRPQKTPWRRISGRPFFSQTPVAPTFREISRTVH